MQVGFLDWLRDLLLWVPKMIWQGMLEALSALLHSIPVPSWLASAGGWFSGLPSGVVYFSQALEIPTGLTIVLAAFVLRFLIRRIPLIG